MKSREEILEFLREVLLTQFAVARLIVRELLQQVLLLACEIGGRNHAHENVVVPSSVAVQVGNSFSAQLEARARLRSFRNVQGLFAFERFHLNRSAQRGGGKSQRYRGNDVLAFALKLGM